MKLTSLTILLLSGYGGGGGGGGVVTHEATTTDANVHSMTIEVDGGNRGWHNEEYKMGFAGSAGKIVRCTNDSHCPLGQACYSIYHDGIQTSGDNKCYNTGSLYGEDCAAGNGDSMDARCASGLCRSADDTCGCLVDDDCSSSDQVCYSVDNTCYSDVSFIHHCTSLSALFTYTHFHSPTFLFW